MEEIKKNELNETKTIDISPISKGRRMLVYLCDLVICFFVAFILYNCAALPLGKIASNYEEKMDIAEQATYNRDDILVSNDLLFYSIDGDRYNFDQNLVYTAKMYTLRFVKDDVESNKNYDVIYNYFVDIKGDENVYLELMKQHDKDQGFFDFVEGKPVLKAVYKAQFESGVPPLDKVSNMSKEGQQNFERFQNDIFLPLYNEVFNDIKINDLTYDGNSFNHFQKIILDTGKYIDVLTISATYSSMILCSIALFLIVPLCNKNGKTISMMMMRVERVGINNIFLLKKGEVALTSVYQIVSCLGCLILIPIPSIPFVQVFRLGSIFVVALLALAIVVSSFFFLMFNKFNRSLFDYTSRTVMISSDSLDEIYRSKGYEI